MAVPSVTLPRPRRRWAAAGERLGSLPWRAEALMVGGIVVLAAVYQYLQAHRRATPWIFPDENRYAAFARAVAETGRNSLHGDRPITGALQSYLLALPWRIGDVATAWELEKAISVTAFCLAAVPAYLFARRLACRPAALLVAAASVLLPAAFYSATLMQEPFAYPLVLTAALLTARLVERFSWTVAIALGAASVIGVGLRGQLAIVPLAAALALLADAAAQAIRRRRPDLRAVWTGVAALVGGAILFRQAYGLSLVQDGWHGLVDHPGTFLRVISYSSATTAIAVAVVPAVALLASLAWLGSAERARGALAAVAAGFVVTFVLYTGLKSASQGFVFITRVEERNLIYLEPIALVALAAVAGKVRARTLIVPATLIGVLIATLPVSTVANSPILSENPGLSWMWFVVRSPSGFDPGVTPLLLGLVVLAFVVIPVRGSTVPLAAGALVLVALAGSQAHRGDHLFSKGVAVSWLEPSRNWVDQAARGREVTVLMTPDIVDQNGIQLLAFWNRSIRDFVVADGGLPTAIGPNVPIAPDGSFPTAAAGLVLHSAPTEVVGRPIAGSGQYVLTEGSPSSRGALAVELSGLAPDAWVGKRFVVRRPGPGPTGLLRVDVSAANPFVRRARRVTVTVGGRRLAWTVRPGTHRRLVVPVPGGPFSVAFALAPAESPGPQDPRLLSLQVDAVHPPQAGA